MICSHSFYSLGAKKKTHLIHFSNCGLICIIIRGMEAGVVVVLVDTTVAVKGRARRSSVDAW